MTERFRDTELRAFARAMFVQAGMEAAKAEVVADVLVEGDLLGHDTHGLAHLPPYLDALTKGEMLGAGEPALLAETPVVQTWNGRKLPGPWLVRQASDWASDAAKTFGMGAVSIQRAGHIGCLAAYLQRIAERGQVLLLFSSDPSTASVAPWGGTRRLFTPNPIAAGWGTGGSSVMMDISMSITTNAMTARRRAEGTRFPAPTLLDADGGATDDPNAFFSEPAGTLLPLGGMQAGHKGAALGMLVEALTSGLSGYGRKDPNAGWGASLLVLVLDPARFGGAESFAAETQWMADAVHGNPPVRGGEAPRLPGERGLARKAEQRFKGVALHPSIPPLLRARGVAAGVAFPAPL
jgi:L-lactate dehydrogenase